MSDKAIRVKAEAYDHEKRLIKWASGKVEHLVAHFKYGDEPNTGEVFSRIVRVDGDFACAVVADRHTGQIYLASCHDRLPITADPCCKTDEIEEWYVDPGMLGALKSAVSFAEEHD